jgi:hypothetical protein
MQRRCCAGIDAFVPKPGDEGVTEPADMTTDVAAAVAREDAH